MYLHRKRPDSNHKGLKGLAEQIGASWLDLTQLGDDAPDALVGFKGITELIEIKPRGIEPKPGQIDFAKNWKGRPIRLVRSGEDLLGLLLGPDYGHPLNVADVVLPVKTKARKRSHVDQLSIPTNPDQAKPDPPILALAAVPLVPVDPLF